MSWCGFHSLYFQGICLASWNYRPMSFIKFGKNSGIIYSNSFSIPLSFSSSFGIPMICMLILLIVSQIPETLLVSSGLFSFCCSDQVNNQSDVSSSGSLILSSVISIQILSPFGEFLFLLLAVFSSMIYILFIFYHFYFFTNIYYF